MDIQQQHRELVVAAYRVLDSRGDCSTVVLALVPLPVGPRAQGIREDENAIRSLGKNVTKYKMQALILGGIFGAIGGILFVLPRSVQPDSLGRAVTFYTWTILLLGGAATIFGPILAPACCGCCSPSSKRSRVASFRTR